MNDELMNHVLLVEAAVQILADRGVIEGSSTITAEGIAAYNQLMASGWKPRFRMVRMVLKDNGVLPPNLNALTDLTMSVADEYHSAGEHSESDRHEIQPQGEKTISEFSKVIEEFDPHTADPHFCWALVQMEQERYVRIKNGNIIPTEKLLEISPQSIVDRSVPRLECETCKAALIAEADGFLTINNGTWKLTEKGEKRAKDLD